MEKMKILVVEDNTVNLATVEQELKDKYEVVPMLSGSRAIKYISREKVDLILLDIKMPVMDGIETLREIRKQENGESVPVIFLTTKQDAVTVLEGAKLGIMDYITKPVESKELHDRIEKVFKRLGVLPMPEEEFVSRLTDILSDVSENRMRQAVFKTDEILEYQMPEEVAEEMKKVKRKLEAGKANDAGKMLRAFLKARK